MATYWSQILKVSLVGHATTFNHIIIFFPIQSHKGLHKVTDYGDMVDPVTQLQSNMINHVTQLQSNMIDTVTL